MGDDFEKYLDGKNEQELQEILNSVDRELYPDRYLLVKKKLEAKITNKKQLPDVQKISNPHQRELANVLTRFAALVIDGLLVSLFYIPILLFVNEMEVDSTGSETYSLISSVLFIAMFVFAFWNNIFRMGRTGQSLGRKFLNIAVLNIQGSPIGVGRAALLEIIGRWILGLICYIGYLAAFWDPDNQMWHDKIANCYVYYVEEHFS